MRRRSEQHGRLLRTVESFRLLEFLKILPHEASKEAALLKPGGGWGGVGGAPALIRSPTWLIVTTRHRGSL